MRNQGTQAKEKTVPQANQRGHMHELPLSAAAEFNRMWSQLQQEDTGTASPEGGIWLSCIVYLKDVLLDCGIQ
jgi:hypothetical protein